MIRFGLTASGESGGGEEPCPALPVSGFTSLQGHKGWLCPRTVCCGSHPRRQSGNLAEELCILGDIICPLSCPRLCMQPMPLWLLCFQKRGQEKFAKYFLGALASDTFPTVCRTCSVLSSSLAPRYTKNPDLYFKCSRRELAWMFHIPPPKCDQFGLSSVFSKPY